MFDKTFFKFLFGFMTIIGLGLVVVVIAKDYSDGGDTVWNLIANFFRAQP